MLTSSPHFVQEFELKIKIKSTKLVGANSDSGFKINCSLSKSFTISGQKVHIDEITNSKRWDEERALRVNPDKAALSILQHSG